MITDYSNDFPYVDTASDDQIENQATHNQYYGGFRYCVPVTAAEETKLFIKDLLEENIKRKTCKVLMSVFIPEETYHTIFPPTDPLPFGWKKFFTKGGRKGAEIGGIEKISIRANYNSLNFFYSISDCYFRNTRNC